jgi:glucokinase
VSCVDVGIDVGGTKILAVRLEGLEVADTERATTPHDPARPAGEPTADSALVAIDALVARAGAIRADAVVGIGLPGMVARGGELVFSPNLPSASGADLTSSLRVRAPELRVVCENDADCAVLAEHHLGAARGEDDVIMVTLGTGIGGGIISEGRLLRGRSGFAGEIGHMVIDANGPRCPCGSRGCWERYASGAGLARLALEAAHAGRLPTIVARRHGDAYAVRGEDVTAAAEEGLEEAVALMDEFGWWLAVGLANLAAIFDTGVFVIGGGLGRPSTHVLPAVERHLRELVEGGERRGSIRVVPSELGERAGAIGAALVARERLR